MSIQVPSELVAYHAFVKSMLSQGGSIDDDATPAAFLKHQHQLNQLRAALQPAADRFERGEDAVEINIDQFVDDVLENDPQAGDHH